MLKLLNVIKFERDIMAFFAKVKNNAGVFYETLMVVFWVLAKA